MGGAAGGAAIIAISASQGRIPSWIAAVDIVLIASVLIYVAIDFVRFTFFRK